MNEWQCTVCEEIHFSGKGLHTGHPVNMSIRPAIDNTGILFERIDIEGHPQVKANISNVISTNRGTTLQNGFAIVHTVEHVLAALTGMGIDNALIRLNAAEPPSFDGSAHLLSNEIQHVGKVTQSSIRNYLVFNNTITHEDETTGSKYQLFPSDHLSFVITLDYPISSIGIMHAELDNIKNFHIEISSSRTYCLLEELEPLLTQNLIQGGDLTNGLVLANSSSIAPHQLHQSEKLGLKMKPSSNPGILSSNELHFPNEPARHKLLDLIGDLTLLGHPIKGKIVASKPGHTSNIAFAKKISQLYDLRS
jgi:UDP-3-O-[3-hydroxymyristoyl] N-acetylglucosamine deacetylase/3-hydroxyacyl-[acyl-carrier-protein] dehydratase